MTTVPQTKPPEGVIRRQQRPIKKMDAETARIVTDPKENRPIQTALWRWVVGRYLEVPPLACVETAVAGRPWQDTQ